MERELERSRVEPKTIWHTVLPFTLSFVNLLSRSPPCCRSAFLFIPLFIPFYRLCALFTERFYIFARYQPPRERLPDNRVFALWRAAHYWIVATRTKSLARFRETSLWNLHFDEDKISPIFSVFFSFFFFFLLKRWNLNSLNATVMTRQFENPLTFNNRPNVPSLELCVILLT